MSAVKPTQTSSNAQRNTRLLTLAAGASLGCVLVFGLLPWILGKPSTLVVLKAESEVLEFTAARAGFVQLPARGMKIAFGLYEGEHCIDDNTYVSPARASKVNYERTPDRFIVTIDGANGELVATLISGETGGAETQIFDTVFLIEDEQCSQIERALTTLPIFGYGTIGEEFGTQSGTPLPALSEATLFVYGRSIEVPYLFEGGELYEVGDPISVPEGSVIEVAAPQDGTAGERTDAQAGAGVIVGQAIVLDDRLDISVSTDATALRVSPPLHDQPLVVRIDRLARLINDPGMVLIGAQVALFLFLFQLWRTVLAPYFLSRAEDEEIEADGSPEPLPEADGTAEPRADR